MIPRPPRRALAALALTCLLLARPGAWAASPGAAQALAEVDRLAPKLDTRFFDAVFPRPQQERLFLQAQDEVVDPCPPWIFTDPAKDLVFPDLGTRTHPVSKAVEATINALMALEESVRALPEEEQGLVIDHWRRAFVRALSNHMTSRREQADKPRPYRLVLGAQAGYDSNVNRSPDGSQNDLSGEDDVQGIAFLNAAWMPERVVLGRTGRFRAGVNVVRLSQVAHQENEAFFGEFEPKLAFTGVGRAETLNFSWRVQDFTYSGKPDSRVTHGLFLSHRLKADLTWVPRRKLALFSSQRGEAAVSWQAKRFDQAAMRAADAVDLALHYGHAFVRPDRKKRPVVYKVDLDLADSATEASPTADSTSYELGLSCTHPCAFGKRTVSITESVSGSFRDKKPADTARGDETAYGAGLSASTSLRKSLSGSASLRYNRIDYRIAGGLDQFQANLGLTWIWP